MDAAKINSVCFFQRNEKYMHARKVMIYAQNWMFIFSQSPPADARCQKQYEFVIRASIYVIWAPI